MEKWSKIKISKEDIDKLSKVASAPSPIVAAYDEDSKEINVQGLPSTVTSFSGMLNPVCKYALTRILSTDDKPIYLTGGSYGAGPSDNEIPIDINKTATVYDTVTAIYTDRIVTAYEQYGTYHVTCYARNKKQSKDYIQALNEKMFYENQYRGKCLLFNGERVVFSESPSVDWEKVILPESTKEKILLNTASFLTNEKYRTANLNQRGLILHGPPGTGKTMLVKSIFKKLADKQITRIYTNAGSFPYTSSVDDLFDFLRFTGSTMLAFEDMDLISPDRSEGNGRKILGSLLNNLDGIRKIKSPLVVVGTTNDVGMLDVALANRPSRFDRKIEIGKPAIEEIKRFYNSLLGFDVEDNIVQASNGFCGAHIEEVVKTAKMLSIHNDIDILSSLKEACTEVQENFFPMMKESSSDETLRKSAQQMFIMAPPGMDMQSIFPQLLPFLNMGIKKQHDVSDAEATAIWNMWRDQENNVKDNVIAHSLQSSVLSSLQDKKIIKTIDNGHISLTDKGKKVLSSLILSMEKNTFENLQEADVISMDEVDKIIHNAGKKSTKKTASQEVIKEVIKEDITNDYYFKAIKDINKDT